MKDMPWTKMANKMKTKSKDDIRNFWFTILSVWFLEPCFNDLSL